MKFRVRRFSRTPVPVRSDVLETALVSTAVASLLAVSSADDPVFFVGNRFSGTWQRNGTSVDCRNRLRQLQNLSVMRQVLPGSNRTHHGRQQSQRGEREECEKDSTSHGFQMSIPGVSSGVGNGFNRRIRRWLRKKTSTRSLNYSA